MIQKMIKNKHLITLYLFAILISQHCNATNEWSDQIYEDLGQFYSSYFNTLNNLIILENGDSIHSTYKPIIYVKDCINNSFDQQNDTIDFNPNFGVYLISWGNTSHGLDLIVIIDNYVVKVFPLEEKYIGQIIRDLFSTANKHTNTHNIEKIYHAIYEIVYPYGEELYRHHPYKKLDFKSLDIYFDVTTFQRKY